VTQEKFQEEVRQKAYELYLQRGAQEGNDVQDWITAEKEVLERV